MKTKSRSRDALGASFDTLERIGNRWTVQVLGALEHAGTLRYNEVRRAVGGISQRMLTLALRDEVTRVGRELSERLRALQAWIQANGVAIPAASEQSH